jgi:hypothetical protein
LLRRKKFPFLHVPFIFFLWAKGTTNLAEPEKHSRTDTYVFSTWWLVDVERTESTWLSLFGRLGTGSSSSCYIRRVFSSLINQPAVWEKREQLSQWISFCGAFLLTFPRVRHSRISVSENWTCAQCARFDQWNLMWMWMWTYVYTFSFWH